MGILGTPVLRSVVTNVLAFRLQRAITRPGSINPFTIDFEPLARCLDKDEYQTSCPEGFIGAGGAPMYSGTGTGSTNRP